MYDRLQYLRFLYTCLYEASTYGGTCVDPLFFHYPYSKDVHESDDHTFMVGGAIKVSPILEALEDQQHEFEAYFPAGEWVNLASS